MHPYTSKQADVCILQATNGRVQFNMEEPALCVHEHISNDDLWLVIWRNACSWEKA